MTKTKLLLQPITKIDIRNKVYEVLSEYLVEMELQNIISKEDIYNFDLSKIGIDSLAYVELFMELEKYCSIKIEDDDIYKFCSSSITITINSISDFVWKQCQK